ncbi:Alpha carbonic anhydrase 8 [Metarhizium brunneum]|uniref:carbonic anhydrase n=1 Tax=Metarhizium brunneum TaxID=500148 RepID=A0A7D5ZAJ5_9HYPO
MLFSKVYWPLSAVYFTQASASCAYGTILQPREEGGAVKVNTFGYIGMKGPTNWMALDPGANSLCANGTSQSPVDMVPGSFSMIPGAELGLDIPDMPEGTEFENLGTTVEVVAKGGNMSFDGVQYRLRQFHFHLPSEHLDNGTSMAMEIHMVWQGEAEQVAVVGVFVDLDEGPGRAAKSTAKTRIGGGRLPAMKNGFFHVTAPATAAKKPSALLETVLSSVDGIAEPGTVVKTQPLVMSDLVSTLSSGSFQTYEGSLTTPPCSEGVRWLVSDQKLSIQPGTFMKARSVIGFNSRFPQNIPGQRNILAVS